MILLGVDTGGTFTDFVLWRNGNLRVHKMPSTPSDPALSIWQGIEALELEAAVKSGEVLLVHGTTVATNAALEGKGVTTAYITNRGFADTLTLGRQARPELYQLRPKKSSPPVPKPLCFEIDCRRDADGKAVKPLNETELGSLVEAIEQSPAQAVAINLLFSYLNPEDELAIEAMLPRTLFVSRSSEVLPEYKEYERGIATWLNAYLGPLMQHYLQNLRQRLHPSHVTVMQSSGGTIAAEAASAKAVNLLLSGPAGGLAAVKFLTDTAQLGGLMTFDMGGTSTDVALVDGDLRITNEGRIGPYPVAVPMVDMHTIGAGGGSIALVDAGGLLQVGPHSAGADPGPACYGKGGSQATVTDANLVLGRLPIHNKLGGTLQLDQKAATDAVQRLAKQLQLSLLATAAGVVDIANEHMARALRVISVQRGYDPRDFRLCSFGGAGGLHVCDLAERLGMSKAVVPIHCGVLSALGLLVAPRERQLSRSLQQNLDHCSQQQIEDVLAVLLRAGKNQLRQEGIAAEIIQHRASVDLRYVGQSAHLNIPFHTLAQCHTAFQQRHQDLYGHHLDMPVELVNVRQRVFASAERLTIPNLKIRSTATVDNSGQIPIYQRETLAPGIKLDGPALICEATATTYLAPNWQLQIDQFGNLLLEQRQQKSPI